MLGWAYNVQFRAFLSTAVPAGPLQDTGTPTWTFDKNASSREIEYA